MSTKLVWECDVCESEFMTPPLRPGSVAKCPNCGAKETDKSPIDGMSALELIDEVEASDDAPKN